MGIAELGTIAFIGVLMFLGWKSSRKVSQALKK